MRISCVIVACLAAGALSNEADNAAEEAEELEIEESKVIATHLIKLQRNGQNFDARATVSEIFRFF
jgi:hypothetical protein